MKNVLHGEFYSHAFYYDIAFDFKNVPQECDFLASLIAQYSPDLSAKSFIEIAAGPALHALEMSRRSWSAGALDLSEEMQAYGLGKATKENLKIQYYCDDMINFKIPQTYDMAAILMDSTSYLLTNEEVIHHLKSVAACLNKGGIYVLEMNHPKSVLSTSKTTSTAWEMSREDCHVKVNWGHPDDVFDPVTQTTNVSVQLLVTDKGIEKSFKDQALQRSFTFTEFSALVLASGVFELVSTYGAMQNVIKLSDKEAWRMVLVLKKK